MIERKLEESLIKQKKMENLSGKAKEKIYDDLVELANIFNKKEKYKYHDLDDLDYYGIRDIENLFDNDNDDNNYYKSILVTSSFKNNYNIMKAEEKNYRHKKLKNIDKKLSVKQYFYKIMIFKRSNE